LSRARVLPLGTAGWSVELGDTLDEATNARVRALDRELAERPFPGFVEAVPTLRSLLVLYDERSARPAAVGRELALRLGSLESAPAVPGRLHEVPTLYGGDAGPDLLPLARELGITGRELVELHAAGEYTAYMLGFKPGFAYLGLLPPQLECARRKTPRVRVPAGSVALAGRQTGIYPVTSPGGWQLVGRTSLRLFDPFRDEPALVAPGDRVRFVPVAELAEAEPPSPLTHDPAAPVALVREPGFLTSIQDCGRSGRRRLGVSAAGALDAPAHAAANRAVGNDAQAAALECTASGPQLEFLAPIRFAVTGADLGAVLERADLGPWPVPLGSGVLARPGNVLRFAGRRSGCRAYIALQGGIDVPAVLGARATDLQSGFGGLLGRALRAGDRLGVATANAPGSPVESVAGRHATCVTLRVVLGPQADHFAGSSVARFLAGSFHLGASSDRVGCRLEGEPMRHQGPAEILSDGMLPGSIQVPPDGQPIVMLHDGPTTGGYPKVATVITADLPLLAQLVPGEGEVRFEAVPLQDL
jgi:KipI family sensor histidine kinase inhibitor